MHKNLQLPLVIAAMLLAAGPALASADAGPEPYSAPTPQYQPMKQERTLAEPAPTRVSLGDATDIQGPAAGPEPYSAPTPSY